MKHISQFFHVTTWKPSIFFRFPLAMSLTLALLTGSIPSFAQIQVFTDRAAWEAALTTVVNENLESVTTDFNLVNSVTTIGTHTFRGTIDGGSPVLGVDVPPLEGQSQFANTTQISWWGTTGGRPRTIISVPSSFGVGFDWKVTATSYGLHNSIFLSATGASGSIYRLLNPIITLPIGPAEGFIGIISPCGGITEYQVYTTFTNWQGYSIDNFAYGSIDGADVDDDNDGWVLCEDCDDTNAEISPGTEENMTNNIDDNCDGLTDLSDYCKSALNAACSSMWLTNVTVGNLNNTTACTPDGYSVYPPTSLVFTPAETYTVYLSGGGAYDQKGSVYIDWNIDGDFDDAGEQVISNVLLPKYGVQVSASFTVPAGIGGGKSLLRVVTDYYTNNTTPCTSAYGEIENYVVTLNGCKDADGDGYKDLTCGGTDCNDADPAINPATVWYQDTDNDNYSNGVALSQCLRPVGYKVAAELTSTTGDCNDNDDSINPSATEICDHIDNDCNGVIDDISGNTVGNWIGGSVGGAGGSASFPPCFATPNDIFTVQANGFSTPSSDQFQIVYQQLCGNGEIIARVLSVSGGGWAGVIMRENLTAGSKKVALKTQLGNSIRRDLRSAANGTTNTQTFMSPQHAWLRLTRSGSTLMGYTSANGQSWSLAFTASISMGACIYAGVFSESTNANTTTTATFNNVSVIGSTAPLQQQYTGFEESTQNWDIEVYPNPSNGLVNLHLLHPLDQPVAVRVLNTLGEQLMYLPELPAGELQPSLDLTGLPAGVYHLLLETEGQLPLSKRVVLTKE